MKQCLKPARLSPTQLRLASDVDSAISRFLELFESDDMRLKAAQILADIIVTQSKPVPGKEAIKS